MEKSDFRILVVDDEEDWVTLNRKVLSRRGFTVEGACSGEEAIDKMKSCPYHMAFLDINMPGIEGIELIDELRSVSPDIAVVMLTGFGTEEKSSAARQKGIIDFLEKIGSSGDHILGDEMADLAQEVYEDIYG